MVWTACEIGLLYLAARRWKYTNSIGMHAVGAVSLPILFLKRRGPHNWYLALTTQTRAVASIAIASAWLTSVSPSCSSAAATFFRELVITAAFAFPSGGRELILAPACGLLVQNALRWRSGQEVDWSFRHVACILSAVPVALTALAVQDSVSARMIRIPQHDGARARLQFRMQHTLQLLFNGALAAAADVRQLSSC
jgi:hypothetical protein